MRECYVQMLVAGISVSVRMRRVSGVGTCCDKSAENVSFLVFWVLKHSREAPHVCTSFNYLAYSAPSLLLFFSVCLLIFLSSSQWTTCTVLRSADSPYLWVPPLARPHLQRPEAREPSHRSARLHTGHKDIIYTNVRNNRVSQELLCCSQCIVVLRTSIQVLHERQ